MEREIYQLSTLLLEQKNIIEKLMEMNGLEKKSFDNSSSAHTVIMSQNQLPNLMHKLDGFAVIFCIIKNAKLFAFRLFLTIEKNQKKIGKFF